ASSRPRSFHRQTPSSTRPRGGNRISPRASSVRRRSDIAAVRTCQTRGSLLEDQIADTADGSTSRSLGGSFCCDARPWPAILDPRSLALGKPMRRRDFITLLCGGAFLFFCF